eukprot:1126820-Amphidinium_carterae.1
MQDAAKMHPEVIIDKEGHGTAFDLAQKYAQKGCASLYLVGSDVMKRPTAQTLVVTKTSQDKGYGGAKFYNIDKDCAAYPASARASETSRTQGSSIIADSGGDRESIISLLGWSPISIKIAV